MRDQSFDEILRAKMRESSTENSHFVTSTEPGWWTSISLNRVHFKKSGGYAGAPEARQGDSVESQQDTENTHVSENTRPETVDVQWDFHQQLAIDQLIRLGADLRLTAPFDEIKVAYKKLLRKYHPDLHQHLSKDEQGTMNERLQLVIESFRMLEM